MSSNKVGTKLKDSILALYEQYGPIEIKCTGADMLPLNDIVDFQGDLKKITDVNKLRLIKNIFINGFVAPFFLWNDNDVMKTLDGHQRKLVITAIQSAGVPIPDKFPVAYIHASDEAEARKFLLSITGQYAAFIQETLDSWTSELDAEIAETLRIVDTEMELAIAMVTEDIEIDSGNNDNNITIESPDDMVKLTVKGITRADASDMMVDFIARGLDVEIKQ